MEGFESTVRNALEWKNRSLNSSRRSKRLLSLPLANGIRRYICYLPGGRSVWEKTVPEVLSTARGRRPRAVLKTKGTVFSHTDRPSPVNNIFIFFLQYIGFTEY